MPSASAALASLVLVVCPFIAASCLATQKQNLRQPAVINRGPYPASGVCRAPRRHFKRTQQSLAQYLLERQQPAPLASPAASGHAASVSSAVSGALPDVSETTPLVAEVRTAILYMLSVLICLAAPRHQVNAEWARAWVRSCWHLAAGNTQRRAVPGLLEIEETNGCCAVQGVA